MHFGVVLPSSRPPNRISSFWNQNLIQINTFCLGPPVLPLPQAHLKWSSSVISNPQSSVFEEVGGRGGSLWFILKVKDRGSWKCQLRLRHLGRRYPHLQLRECRTSDASCTTNLGCWTLAARILYMPSPKPTGSRSAVWGHLCRELRLKMQVRWRKWQRVVERYGKIAMGKP